MSLDLTQDTSYFLEKTVVGLNIVTFLACLCVLLCVEFLKHFSKVLVAENTFSFHVCRSRL